MNWIAKARAFASRQALGLGKRVSRAGFQRFLSREIAEIEGTFLNLGCGPNSHPMASAREVRVDLTWRQSLHLCGDAHCLPFKADSFDGVLLEEMLEHCQSPHRVLEEVQRVLRPEGKLILTAPFLYPLHDRPGDYYRFTEHGLRYLLRGFSNLSIVPHHSGYGSFIVLFERLIMEPGGVRYLKFAIAPLAYLMLLLDPIVTPLLRLETYTTGYFVTAVK